MLPAGFSRTEHHQHRSIWGGESLSDDPPRRESTGEEAGKHHAVSRHVASLPAPSATELPDRLRRTGLRPALSLTSTDRALARACALASFGTAFLPSPERSQMLDQCGRCRGCFGHGRRKIHSERHRGGPQSSQFLRANQLQYERRCQRPHQGASRLIGRQLMFGCCGHRVATAAHPDLAPSRKVTRATEFNRPP